MIPTFIKAKNNESSPVVSEPWVDADDTPWVNSDDTTEWITA